MLNISSAMAIKSTQMAELVETRPSRTTARKNIIMVRQGLPLFIFLVTKKSAKRRVRPVSDMTMLSMNAQTRKGTMTLPQVFWKRALEPETPVRPTTPTKSRLGQPISTLIHR